MRKVADGERGLSIRDFLARGRWGGGGGSFLLGKIAEKASLFSAKLVRVSV